jgi:hypothetical protein
MRLHKIKKILHIKRNNYQIEEAAYRLGNNLCELFIRERIDIQNTKSSKKIKHKRTNDPVNKWANELKRQFSKEEKWQ